MRKKRIDFVPHLYDYIEKGGTRESARQLGVDEHAVVKTLVFETSEKKPLVVLMHGDGGTSPFGTKAKLPVYAERTIFEIEKIFINGGKRGFLMEISTQVLAGILAVNAVEVGIIG